MSDHAFANRSELTDRVLDTINRVRNATWELRVGSWIKMHEARANRVLRERNQVVRATAVLQEGFIRLPQDWKEAQHIELLTPNGKPRPLTMVTQEYADKVRAEELLTEPHHYCIVGAHLEIVPYTAAALQLSMTYYKGVAPLTVDGAAATNWLLQEHPDYYFYGTLVHSAPFLRDDERIATWGTLAQAAQDEMLLATERARFSGSRLKTRARLRN